MIKRKATFLNTTDLNKLKPGDEFDYYTDETPSDDVRDHNNNGVFTQFNVEYNGGKKVYGPGVYNFVIKNYDAVLEETPLHADEYFGANDIQNRIIERAELFFSRVDKVKAIGESRVRRGVLLHGQPGAGKSLVISHTCMTLQKGAIIIKFDTAIRFSSLSGLLNSVKPSPEVDKLIVILEDIGGGEVEPEQASRLADTSLLNFIDGTNYALELPMLIFATTNYPQNMLANLIDRPGRFDDVIEVKPPVVEVKVKFMEKLLKRELTEKEKDAITDEHSMAHVKGAVIDNILYDAEIDVRLREMTEHSKKVKRGFEEDKTMGFGRD